jgi:hypothetical protein
MTEEMQGHEDRRNICNDRGSRLSKRIANNDDAAANEEEVEDQIQEDQVKRTARESAASFPMPILGGNEEIRDADNASASGEEVEEQAERKRIEKDAFKNRISTASAEKWMQSGRSHE